MIVSGEWAIAKNVRILPTGNDTVGCQLLFTRNTIGRAAYKPTLLGTQPSDYDLRGNFSVSLANRMWYVPGGNRTLDLGLVYPNAYHPAIQLDGAVVEIRRTISKVEGSIPARDYHSDWLGMHC